MSPRIVKWYLSCQAVPYWYILFADCAFVFIAGILGFAINHGVSNTIANFGSLLYALCTQSATSSAE